MGINSAFSLRLVTDPSTYSTGDLRLSRCSFLAVRALGKKIDVVETREGFSSDLDVISY